VGEKSIEVDARNGMRLSFAEIMVSMEVFKLQGDRSRAQKNSGRHRDPERMRCRRLVMKYEEEMANLK